MWNIQICGEKNKHFFNTIIESQNNTESIVLMQSLNYEALVVLKVVRDDFKVEDRHI